MLHSRYFRERMVRTPHTFACFRSTALSDIGVPSACDLTSFMMLGMPARFSMSGGVVTSRSVPHG